MASTINAKSTGSGSLESTADASGVLALQTGGVTAVTIDASQNVGIGRTSVSYKFEVNDTSLLSQNAGSTTGSVGTALALDSKTSGAYATGQGSALNFQITNSAGAQAGCKIASINNADNNTADLVFYPRNYGYTEAMRINSSGNVGIGTSSPNQTVEIKNGSDYQIRFNNGTTAQSYDIGRSTSNGLLYFYGRQTGFTGYVFSGVDGERLRIDTNGNITAMGIYNTTTAGAVNVNVRNDGYLLRSTSALKYKTDIRDLPSIDINKFRPVVYKSKCEGDDKTKDHFGIIADEVDAAGIKELVAYNAEGEVEGFQYERLTAVLVKAIQEQQELIKQLQADVAALKGNK